MISWITANIIKEKYIEAITALVKAFDLGIVHNTKYQRKIVLSAHISNNKLNPTSFARDFNQELDFLLQSNQLSTTEIGTKHVRVQLTL